MPFWTLVIHCQISTPTTGGVAHTSTRATLSSSRTQVETRASSSAISIPIPIVSPTLTAVNRVVRISVCQKTESLKMVEKF